MDWLAYLTPIVKHKDRRHPLYLRITDGLRQAIESGSLKPNDRLPPDRELSKILGVDRSTIARAYDLLSSEGLINSHVGRGTFVGAAALAPSSLSSVDSDEKALAELLKSAGKAVEPAPLNRIVWTDKFSRASQIVFSLANRQTVTAPASDCISFASGIPSEEFFPQREFDTIVSDILASPRSADLFCYSQPEGHPSLRKEVLSYLGKQGIAVKDEQLLILSGSQQGIDLVSRTFIDEGDVVLMEDPTYFWAMCNFAAKGARCVPVASDHEGLRLEAFENAASSVNAKLLYLIPSFQNPTGATMPLERRKRLLNIARKHQVPLLEDNFVGDLAYEPSVPTLFSLDGGDGTVIYQGTFSKALCPGLRLGWLVAPEPVLARLQLAKRASDLSTNSMSQVVLAEYLSRGLYEERLATVVAAYRERLDVMCDELTRSAADWLSWKRPQGGMFIWAKLPPGYSSRELLNYAEREGVTFSPGDVFNVSGGRSEYLRLTFIQQNPEAIKQGVARLGKALKSYGSSRKKLQRPDGSYQVAEASFI